MRIDREDTALVVVDMQNDFIPGGALAVPDADAIVAPLARLMESGVFSEIVAVQDWHPRGHVSFASSHPGRKPYDVIDLYGHEQILWPDHCVQGTPGAELHRGLPWHRVAAIVRKATDPATDSYSAIRNNWNPRGERPQTGLAGYLKDRGVRRLMVCGVATDFCVLWTAEDATREGFQVGVIWDLCRAIETAAEDEVRDALAACGAEIVESSALLASR